MFKHDITWNGRQLNCFLSHCLAFFGENISLLCHIWISKNVVVYTSIVLDANLKVCHSSTFQIILARWVDIKIIKHSGSILANLNNAMQTKQHTMKKTQSI